MTNYNSKYYSLTFTIIVIITMFIGIVMSIVYSKSIQHLAVKHSFQPSNNKTKRYSTFYYEDYNIIKPYRVNFELYESPINSVPIKLKLGKITTLNNSNIPKLELLLSAIDKVTFQTEYNNPLIKHISPNYYSFID